MKIPTIDDIDIKDKKVLLRLDFDFLFKNGFDITDYHELNLVIPTVKKLIEENSRIVIAANYKQIKNDKKIEYPMEKFAAVFCDLLNCEVYLTEERAGSVVNRITQEMVPGSILILNNFSNYPDETDNYTDFAKNLSEVADVYINEAITLSHLELASTTTVLNYYEAGNVCVGRHFDNEYRVINLVSGDERPCAMIINSNNIDEVIEIIEDQIDKVDKLLLIGKISKVFSDINSCENGSDIPLNLKDKIECLIKLADMHDIELLYMVDYFLVQDDSGTGLLKKGMLDKGDIMLDIGESTGNLFSDALSGVRKLIWFGDIPLGSEGNFLGGTSKILETIREYNIPSAGLLDNPENDYNKFNDSINPIVVSRCFDISTNLIKKEKLPVLEYIEGKFK